MEEILLVGNPNSGKTTLFNMLTRSNEHIGNWHGVTVENKKKAFSVGENQFLLVDTPGIYSLTPMSFEEKVAVDEIFKGKKIINLCDQNNIQRNLYLTLCLLEKDCDVVLVINQIDKKPIFKIDAKKLSQMLGIEVVLIDAEKNVEPLLKCLNNKTQTRPNLPYLKNLTGDFSGYELVKAWEKDESFFEKADFSSVPGDSVERLAQMRYDFIDKVLKTCAIRSEKVYGKSVFDKIALNKFLAFPVFILILSAIFYLTFFSLGEFLSNSLQSLLNLACTPFLNFLEKTFQNSWVFDLFNTAIIGGVGTVLSFLPQVVLLFFFLSVLEDTGYMSRVAFIFEDILGKIGLSGKSVYTLLMGFGCSTTAIMTSRNMDDKNAKTKTAILCPYMSCSAKIPIYTVVGGAFFGANNIFCIIGLYFLGVVVAIVMSKIFDATVLKSKSQSFILEFPPYRKTSLKRVGKILWKNVKEFLIRIGTVMISMNIVVWVLSSFSFKFSYVAANGGVSMLESFGKFLAPIFTPLGFNNWAIVASLLAGIVAKEVVVSSIAMFNHVDSGATKLISGSLLVESSTIFFASKASVLSFLVFCLLYTPCIASISMLLQEVGKKWTILSVIIQLVVAYVVAFFVYQVAFAIEIFGATVPLLLTFAVLLIIFATLFIVKAVKKRKCCASCTHCDQNCNKK